MKSTKKGSTANQYIVQNLILSGVYMSINFSNSLLQKLLNIFIMTTDKLYIYVVTMTTDISDSYNYL